MATIYQPSHNEISIALPLARLLWSGFSGARALTDADRARWAEVSQAASQIAQQAIHDAYLGRVESVRARARILGALSDGIGGGAMRACGEDRRIEAERVVCVALRAVQGGSALAPQRDGQPALDAIWDHEEAMVLRDVLQVLVVGHHQFLDGGDYDAMVTSVANAYRSANAEMS